MVGPITTALPVVVILFTKFDVNTLVLRNNWLVRLPANLTGTRVSIRFDAATSRQHDSQGKDQPFDQMKHKSAFNSNHGKFEPTTLSGGPIHIVQEHDTVDSQHCFTKTDDGQKESVDNVNGFPAIFRLVWGFIAVAAEHFETDLKN